MSSTTTPRLGAHRTPAARLGVQVVHDLVSAIVTGEVAPGDLLPTETELCENFGVSRTVIRESMKRLEEKGISTTRSNSASMGSRCILSLAAAT